MQQHPNTELGWMRHLPGADAEVARLIGREQIILSARDCALRFADIERVASHERALANVRLRADEVVNRHWLVEEIAAARKLAQKDG
jgi:hypothetical protein